MKRKLIIGSLVVVCLLMLLPSITMAKPEPVDQQQSTMYAYAFIKGRISGYEFYEHWGPCFGFYAEKVTVFRLAAYGCSTLRVYRNENVSMRNYGYFGYVSDDYLFLIMKTMVNGPI